MNKWDQYHQKQPPWESGQPISQFVEALTSGVMPSGDIAVDVGCGSGISTIYLANTGRYKKVYGLDISMEALKKAMSFSSSAIFRHSNLLEANTELIGKCSAVYDCQTFHALRADQPDLLSVICSNLASLLATGGRLLIVAGNSTPDLEATGKGPSTLTRDELVEPFLQAGLTLISIASTRFDSTAAYGKVPPLAWVAIFEK
jgi:SAM-dependent methyltransferase